MSDSLWPHVLQLARLPYPSPSLGAYSNSCPLSHWCHQTITSSAIPLFCLIFPRIRVFPQVSSSYQVTKVLARQLQHQSFQWIFSIDFLSDWLVWSPCCPRDSQESSQKPQLKSINSSAFGLPYGLTLTSIHDYWKNHSFDQRDLSEKVVFLLFNMLSRLFITFLPRSKHLLISWL